MAKRNLILLVVVVAIAVGLYELAPLTAQQDSMFQSYAPLVEVDGMPVGLSLIGARGSDELLIGFARRVARELERLARLAQPD